MAKRSVGSNPLIVIRTTSGQASNTCSPVRDRTTCQYPSLVDEWSIVRSVHKVRARDTVRETLRYLGPIGVNRDLSGKGQPDSEIVDSSKVGASTLKAEPAPA